MSEAVAQLLAERLALLPCEPLPPEAVLHRDAPHGPGKAGRTSANGHCRIFATADGWAALNLARPDDLALVPAMTEAGGEGWRAVEQWAAGQSNEAIVARGAELHLPVARLGEAPPMTLAAGARVVPHRVVDLSALWAGPLCGALLARAGSEVIRIESVRRPDPTPNSSPRLDAFLNGAKEHVALDLASPAGRVRLRELILQADVLITSARAGALERLGLDPALLRKDHPELVWAAVTAHGWASERVGFGDDCAFAGGLVEWREDTPDFVGDALADPLTGVEAALAVCSRLAAGTGGLIDLPLAGVAAAYAGRGAV